MSYQFKIDRCAWCDTPLVQEIGKRQVRSDKRFCSSVHRMAYNRWLKNIRKREAQAKKAIALLGGYLQHQRAQETACKTLVDLRNYIKEVIKENGVRIVE